MTPETIDLPGITGVGVVVVLVGFIFRTLWLQGAAWKELVVAARVAATTAEAKASAAEAKAHAAETKAVAAENAVRECRRDHAQTQRQLRRLQDQVDRLTAGKDNYP